MKKSSQTLALLFLALAGFMPMEMLAGHGKHKHKKVEKTIAERPTTQSEKFIQYQDIITPIILEAEGKERKPVLTSEAINGIVFFALLRDGLKLFSARTVVPSATYGSLSLTPLSLDNIVRLMQLCDFLKSGPFYKKSATLLENIFRGYCSYPASRPVQKARLAALIKPLIDDKKLDPEPKRKDQ